MSNETTPSISLSERTKVRLPLVMLVAIVGAVAAAAIDRSNILTSVEAQRAKLVEQDERLRRLELAQAEIAVMRNDVLWIRRALERERAREQ